MRISVHIGPDGATTDRLQGVLSAKRDGLVSKGILYARSPGNKNHTRLFMAVSDPDNIDLLRHHRGYGPADAQDRLRAAVAAELAAEIARHKPKHLILSAAQLGSALSRPSEIARLHDLLSPLSDDIRIVAHVDEPGRVLVQHYAEQISDGRIAPLDVELGLSDAPCWWDACLDAMPEADPEAGIFSAVHGPPFWLDYTQLVAHWEAAFGKGALTLRPADAAIFCGAELTDEIRAAFGIKPQIGQASAAKTPDQPAAAWLARGRQLNVILQQMIQQKGRVIPRPLRRQFMQDIRVDGPAIEPGSLYPVSKALTRQNEAILDAHKITFPLPPRADTWVEADPTLGYRASQYALAFRWRIDRATREARKNAKAAQAVEQSLTPEARAVMPPLAVEKFADLQRSIFAPHNRIGAVNEEALASAFAPVPARILQAGSTGNVIIACMKNEAPYIAEWIAHHRAVGVDNFLIYTNGCEDGTDAILQRLDSMGIVQHRDNDDWKGASPQQFALNAAMNEPVVRQADWIIHIDVDEFINVRAGNGTLQDFFDLCPDATNVAMTWRLFGHNGVTELRDDFVIDQFDTCAPKYCPKPHTVWGFKTMSRNIGAYQKLSCHRPNKLDPAQRGAVKWVNGSGRDMTSETVDNGWRNSKRSIGYDLLQLNHYALRSAESFLIKRQRGRALHVDRSIGLNYWIRMDWSVHRDITIKRNLPRLREEYDRLMQDDRLKALHQQGFDWHRAKATELRANPEFQDLYDKALAIRLTETERAAYALALDMES